MTPAKTPEIPTATQSADAINAARDACINAQNKAADDAVDAANKAKDAAKHLANQAADQIARAANKVLDDRKALDAHNIHAKQPQPEIPMFQYDTELKMYAENGLRTVEDWTSLGRAIDTDATSRVAATNRGQTVPLFSRDQTHHRPRARSIRN